MALPVFRLRAPETIIEPTKYREATAYAHLDPGFVVGVLPGDASGDGWYAMSELPSLSTPLGEVSHIEAVLRRMDLAIDDQLALFAAHSLEEPFIDALIIAIDLADELRHELCEGIARMPDAQSAFMAEVIASGCTDGPDEDDEEEDELDE